jgi:autotransporter-associated beta strand protein
VPNFQSKRTSQRLAGSRAATTRARRRAALLASTALIIAADLALGVTPGQAQSATWAGPGADWDTGTNWSTTTVPTNTATFAGAAPTSLTFSTATTSIATMQFNAGAPAYTFSLGAANTFNVTGTGVSNSSSNAPTFIGTGLFSGTINFQNASTAGNANFQLSQGLLSFQNTSNAGTATIANTIGGDARFPGTIEFHQNSSAANATLNIVGTTGVPGQGPGGSYLAFFDSSTAGSANITIDQGICGGGVGACGPGSAIFVNTSTAGNATIVTQNNAAVQFGFDAADTSSAGNAHITNNTGGNTNFEAMSTAGNATINNNGGTTNFGIFLVGTDTATAGNATITNTASGTVNFYADTTAGNATITNNGGFVQFGTSGGFVTPGFADSATAGNAIIKNNGGTVSFNSLTNAGSANITNSFGFVFFNDDTSASNATISNSGSVSFLDSTTAGSANITTQAGGFLLSFADSSTAGSATITTKAGSEVQFTDSASGGTARFIFSNGTMDLSGLTSGGMTAGSIEGSGTVELGGNALTVGGNNLSTTYSGSIVDGGTFGGSGGSLVKTGTGTLTLSGISTYSGTTTINQGTLQLDGSINSPVIVNSGGIFSGNGTAHAGVIPHVDPGLGVPAFVPFGPIPPALQVNSGGVFAPGLPGQPGTSMTVNGNLAFQSGAIYLIQLNASSTTFANVIGTAALAGTVEAFFTPGSYMVPKTYDILKSTGLGGTTFTSLVTVPANFKANLSYSTTDVFLNLTAVLGLNGNLNVNQQNVANAISGFFNGGGALPPNFANVFALTGPTLANALSQLDGEVAVDAEATAFKSMSQFLSLMLDPFVDGKTGSPSGGALGFAPDRPQTFPSDIALAYDAVLKAPPKPAPFEDRWTTWGAAYGGASNTNGNPTIGSTNFSAQTFGFAAGMDRHFGPDLVAGFALAGGGTHWGLAQAMGTGRSDAFQAGVYATKYFGPAYVAADIAFANQWMTTNRTAFAGDQLTASFNAQSYGGRVEAGYRYALPATWATSWTVTPYGALQVQNFHTPQYSEADLTGGGFGLSYAAQSAYDTRSEVGTRFDEPTTFNGMPLTLRARLAWAHDWVNGPALSAVFQTLPGANFVVNGAPVPKNSALTTAGAELHLTQAWSLLTKFDGEFAKNSQTYAGTGTLRYVW